MKKRVYLTVIAVIIVAAALLLSSCGSDQPNDIEGSYSSAGTVYTFAKDGTMSLEKDGEISYGTFRADNGHLTLSVNGSEQKYDYTYESSVLSLFRPGSLIGTQYSKTADAADSIDGWKGELPTESVISESEEPEGRESTEAASETESAAEVITESTTPALETGSSSAQTEPASETIEPTTPEETTQETAPEETTTPDRSAPEEETTVPDETVPEDFRLTGDFYPGAIVTMGRYEQDNNTANGAEPIEWAVLKVDGNRVFLMSLYGLDSLPYDYNWGASTWNTSTLRYWLNDSFINTAFTPQEQAVICTTSVTADGNPDYATYAGEATEDRIFLLSANQAYMYFVNYWDRICTPTAYAIAQGAFYDSSMGGYWWWLRSPGRSNNYAALITPYGTIDYVGYYTGETANLVRPVMWVNVN